MVTEQKVGRVIDYLLGPEIGGSSRRPFAFLEWAETLSIAQGGVFWDVVREVWPVFDFLPHNRFAALFKRFSKCAPIDHGWPENVTVYRGQHADADLGLSWTLDKSTAREFARGHRGVPVSVPVVFEHTVSRNQVAFFTDQRGEQEVVLLTIPTRAQILVSQLQRHDIQGDQGIEV